ncbi:MAG: PKD domain-containing protein [Isosphaeraceae bacterium]
MYTVVLLASDAVGDTAQGSAVVNVSNVAPSARLVAPTSVSEGSSIVVSLVDPTDPSAADLTAGFSYAFDPGDGSGFGPYGASSTITLPTTTYGARTVRARIKDKDGGFSEYTASITVLNVAPAVNVGGNASIVVGAALSRSGSFTDPGADHWTATVDYGDNSGIQPLTLNPDKTFKFNHVYAAPGTFTVTVGVDDGGGVIGRGGFVVTVSGVANVAPSVNVGGNATLVLGTALGRTGSFIDPDANPWVATVDYGDNTGLQPLLLNTDKTFFLSHGYSSAGTFTVTVNVDDGAGAIGHASLLVVVSAPVPAATVVEQLRTTTSRGSVTSIALTFSDALDPARAQDLKNYALINAGKDRKLGTKDDVKVAIKKATYNATTHTVTLTPSSPAASNVAYQLMVQATNQATALTDSRGKLIDGNNDGNVGGNYVGRFGPPLVVQKVGTTAKGPSFSSIVLTFSDLLDASRAQAPGNYVLLAAGNDGRWGTGDDKVIRLKKPAYKSSKRTVTLTPTSALPRSMAYQLTIKGTTGGLADINGNLLDGNKDSIAGGNYAARFGAVAKGTPPARTLNTYAGKDR